jgi:hypothetical protein
MARVHHDARDHSSIVDDHYKSFILGALPDVFGIFTSLITQFVAESKDISIGLSHSSQRLRKQSDARLTRSCKKLASCCGVIPTSRSGIRIF